MPTKKMSKRETERAEAIKALRAAGVKPGAKVYTKLDHVSRSGMMRRVSVYLVKRGEIRNVTALVSTATGLRWREGSLVIGGCGTDVGFETVYHLGRAMFPKGGSLKHSPRAWQEREVGRETDGGYLLRQSWL